jgi:hypothetical protein
MRALASSIVVPAGLALALSACPPADQKKTPPPSSSSSSSLSVCSKVGQTCEVSPGKLGSCVQKDDCNDAAGCFVCQSQH